MKITKHQQSIANHAPDGWSINSIGEIATIKIGGDLQTKNFSPRRTENHQYQVYSNTVENFGLYGYYSTPEYPEASLTMIGRGVGLGKAFPRHEKFGAIGRLIVITPNKNFDFNYLSQYINEKITIHHESSGIPQLTGIGVAKYTISAPPLIEQRAIASALSDMDALLAKLDQLIAKKRDIKQAAMQELLTGRRRLPGFSGEWTVAALRNLGAWKGGATPSMANPDFWVNGDVPWASSGDIKSTTIDATAKSITELAVESSSTTVAPTGSVVMVTRSGILRRYFPVAKTSKPIAINQDIKALIPASGVDTEFVLQSLLLHGPDILSSCMKAGTTVESVELSWLKAYEIDLPSLDEQQAIAALLRDMAAEITALEARREKTRLIKQGMMQELLSGRVRLI